MKILSFSLDNQLFKKDSAVAVRLASLAQIGVQVDFVVPSQKKTVVSLNDKVRVLGSGGQTKIDRWLLIYLLGRTLIQEEKYDLLTVQDTSFLALTATMLGRAYGLPVEIQVHGFEKRSWFKNLIIQFVLKQAAGVRVVSNRLKKEIISNYHIAPEKIYIIPIVSPFLNREPIAPRPYHSPFNLLAIGRLVPVKGFHYLVEAVAKLKQAGIDFELTIIGEGGEYNHLNKLIRNYGLGDKVVIKKPTSNLKEEYQKADLFIISSIAEGYSLVATEAASFGLPVVMTDVGLAGELLINNQSAKIVSPANVEELATAIKELLANPELAGRLGQAAFTAVQTVPSEEATLFLYKEAWAKLL